MKFAVFLTALALPAISEAYVRPLCNGYVIDAPRIVKFNSNEKKLICGDPDVDSWKRIPRFQSEYFIRTFLQQRGYFYPEFIEKDDIVTIVPGKRTLVRRIEVEGNPPHFFKVWRRRRIRGQPLTPGALDTLEGWTKNRLRDRGYACPSATTEADAETGEITLSVDPGLKQRIISLDVEEVEGLRQGTLERFNAFHVGDPYNLLNTQLTSRRIVNDGILQSSYFLTDCTPEGVRLQQKSLKGAKRLLSIGVGASTEEYGILKVTFKQSRIGKNASSFLLTGRGSFRRQRLLIQGIVYPLPFPTRWHTTPTVLVQRTNETKYEYINNDLWLPAAVGWDTQNTGFQLTFGPKFNFTRTIKGAQPGWTHFTSLATKLEIASHDYEYNLGDPRSGYIVTAMAQLNSDKILSSVTAQKLTIRGQKLWNIAGFEPPLFVLGIRGEVGTTIVDRGSAGFARLPPWFLYYLGSSRNMRGFSQMQLPNANRGALTSIYTGVELRLANVLPLNIQPIAFVDFATMGARTLDLDRPAYWSPGLGVRWPSFIGVVRLTVAHGYLIRNNNPANNNLSHWQFYFTLGEEF